MPPSAQARSSAALALLVLALAAPWLLSSYDLNLLARFLALSLTAMGLVLLWGEGGVLSLGQGVFFGLGGYAIAMHLKLAESRARASCRTSWSGPASTAAARGGGRVPQPGWSRSSRCWWSPRRSPALFAWAIFRRRIGGRLFRADHPGAGARLRDAADQPAGQDRRLQRPDRLPHAVRLQPQPADDRRPGSTSSRWPLVVAALFGLRWLIASRFGKLLRASRDGSNRLRFLGYDPAPYKVVAFTVAALLASISGALFTLHAGVVSPALVGVVPSIEMVIWVAIGGRDSLAGALAGALLVNFAKDKVSTALPELWLYALGALFILAVTALPKGLAGAVRRRAAVHARAKPATCSRAGARTTPAAPVSEPTPSAASRAGSRHERADAPAAKTSPSISTGSRRSTSSASRSRAAA